jgi:hypothetical protein
MGAIAGAESVVGGSEENAWVVVDAGVKECATESKMAGGWRAGVKLQQRECESDESGAGFIGKRDARGG